MDQIFNTQNYPYTNYQQINIDWIFDILKALAGGTTGLVLTKVSDTDYDFTWSAGGGGGGGVISVNGQTGVVTLAIPTKTSELTNNSGFITAAQAPVTSVNGQTGAVSLSIPSASTSLPANLAANAAVGTGTTWARSNHVHKLPTPSDIGAVPTSAYNPDSKTSSMTQSVGVDSSGKLWTAPGGGGGAVSSVNGYTGTVVLTASDVGAMAAVTGTTAGQVLTWTGSAWAAQALPVYSGGVG